MNSNSTLLTTLLATATGATLQAAVPQVADVDMAQDSSRLVTITYTLKDAPAVITLDVQTNDTNGAWTSIGGVAVCNAMGDVWKKVGTSLTEGGSFNGTITWHPDHSWPDHKIAEGGARAVVTAWDLGNTPDYMVVDLAVANTVRYYPGVDFLPGTVPGQTGAVTNNPAYKTSKLLMRKIMARGVEWTMGSAAGETQRYSPNYIETPHVAILDSNYYIGVFEVTQYQWKNIAVNSAAKPLFATNGDMRPMEKVSYNEIRNTHSDSSTDGNVTAGTITADPSADSFLGLLRAKTGVDFDLPTEAQWEFAARSGHGSGFWNDGSPILNTDQDANLGRLARYLKNNPTGQTIADVAPEKGGTAIVGSYAPSDWGLYDMHGNVFEWCLDWYKWDIRNHGGKLNISPSDPSKTLDGQTSNFRPRRGGSWFFPAGSARPAFR